MHDTAVAVHTFANCPACGIVAPIKVDTESADVVMVTLHHPFLVSIKNWDEICAQDMEDALSIMEKHLGNCCLREEAKAHCLPAVVVGSSRSSEAPEPRGGLLPNENIFDCVILSDGPDQFGVLATTDTHILHELTTRPQKCDAEVLPLPGTNSTVQTLQRPEQKHTCGWPITNVRVTPLIGCSVSQTWANPLGPLTHLSWVLAR